MSKINTKYSVEQGKNLFSEAEPFFDIDKPVQVSFTAPDLSSLGGLALVSKAEKACGIIGSLARCVNDWRNPDLIHHSIYEMMRQRVMQIACGYEDADDCDALRSDSMLKMSCGRSAADHDLCSQPTMTRLENHVGHTELYDMGEAFIDNFIKSYGNDIPAKIILDFDDSNADTYGHQELTLFNTYYSEYCYMPLFIFEGYSGRLILPILRPGRTNKRLNVFGIMRRLIERIRRKWPHVDITVRGDAMFCCHELFEWADTQKGVHYCVGVTGNSVLLNHSAILNHLAKAENQYRLTKEPQRLFTQLRYKAKSWKKERWVIAKVEYNEKGSNVRFIVTDRTPKNTKDSQRIYEKLYCRRGMCELWIKELKDGLRIDRMSCHRFSANQFRVFLHAAAYVLLWHVRQVQLKGSEAESWTINTLRIRILLSAVRITTQKTKIKIEFGRDHPEKILIQFALRRA